MATQRSKRWNGDLNTLSSDFLKDVIEKMLAYGDRVQFELPEKSTGKLPCYQVVNATERKMGFDARHLILRLEYDGNVSERLSVLYTLEGIKAAMNGTARKAVTRRSTSARTSTGGTRTVTAAVQATDALEKEKYTYFKNNRSSLPEEITQYSAQISKLMQDGLSAENAFQAIITQHFS